MPRQKVRKTFPDLVLLPEFIFEERCIESNPVPRDEGEIGICPASVNKLS